MGETSDEYPKTVEFLPGEGLDFAYLRALKNEEDNSIRQVWVPRFPSLDEADADGDNVWDLSVGVVPLTGIEEFIVEWDEKVAFFELNNGIWQVNEPTERAELNGHVFAHQIKPYVEIRRSVDAWKFDQKHEQDS